MQPSPATLYLAFAAPRPTDVAGCPCCVDDRHRAALMSAPLRALPAADLSRFAFKAMTTWGTAADYRYFLPRILELACDDAGRAWPGFDIELVVSKMLCAGWTEWSAGQRAAVSDWLGARWQAEVEGGSPAEELLEGLELLGDDLGARFAWWQGGLERAGPLRALADALIADWGRLGVRSAGRLVQWMLGPPRRAALEAGFERWVDRPWADTLAEAIDAFDWAMGVRLRTFEAARAARGSDTAE